MTNVLKRTVGFVLTVCMLCSLLAGVCLTVSAAGTTVSIESFLRGPQEDLRSSELLVAKVEGYEGNVLDLTYTWTSSLGTYLYVYNSHNMYSINDTAGEVEIYNSTKGLNATNASGYHYDKTFTGQGFAYASVYGANINSSSSLVGTVTVTVTDAAGNVIGTDSHTGSVTREFRIFRWVYTYHGFVLADLEQDIDNVAFGIFEGDTRNVKDLLGESAILHITCEECTVTNGEIISGDAYISLSKNGDYYITGEKAGTSTSGGDAQVSLNVKKSNCKFHQNSSAAATTTVYVYKKPTPVPTTTTITLAKESLDDRCRYFIDGVEATTQADGTVIFTGLTPNTDYQIEVVGDTEDTQAAYAYVYTKTLPVYNANIQVYLNGTYDSVTGTVTSGTLVDLTEMGESDNDLFIKATDSNVFVELVYTGKGSYSVGVENGVYLIYAEADTATLMSNQQLVIEGDNRTRYLFYNSVEYDAAGGTGAPATEYYYSGLAASVNGTAPTREGYLFQGWQDENGNVYQPGDAITDSIAQAYKLTAIWDKAVNVYVHVNINHVAADGVSRNNDKEKYNILFTVDGREGADGNYTELATKDIQWDGTSTFSYDGYTVISPYASDATLYQATEPTFENMPADMQYTFTSAKSGYELISVETSNDENGDVVIEAELIYDPLNFDFAFAVKLDDAAKALQDDLKPKAVNVKVTSWYDFPYDDTETVAWYEITQHYETYVRMELDANGEATGTFPVWISTTDGNKNYSYRIEVVSYELQDGTIIDAVNVNDQNEYYKTQDERYTAYVEVVGGSDPDTTDSNTLTGAYYNGTAQVGTVTAIVSIEVFDVTFNPNGGVFSDGTTAAKTAKNQVAVPSFAEYVPTREGGYTFLGWYLADANGNITDTTVAEGEALYSDITLMAKWQAPISIEGTVSVAGTYELDGKEIAIYDVDRANAVYVLLQAIDANGYANTIESKKIDITYTNGLGSGTYAFANIPNDGTKYRIKVMNANYGELYQNEASYSQTVTDFAAYDTTHYNAVLGGDSIAVVNAYLPFDPASFALQYEVDALAIGEGFRPQNVGMLILYDDTTGIVNPQEWPVISQQKTDDGYQAQDTALSGGVGANDYEVWSSMHDGTTLYDYAIRVLNCDGAAYDAQTAPYMIHYNGIARYSATEGQTQMLKATLVPKMYSIIFDVNAEGDTVTNMNDYLTIDDTYEDTYYWSFGKEITARPARNGYIFRGWYDESGNKVTEISADSHEAITLTAKWEYANIESYINNYAYIFGYNDTTMGAEGPLLRCEVSAMVHRLVKQNGKLGSFVYDPTSPSFNDIAGEWFQSGIEFVHYMGAFTAAEGSAVQPYVAVTRGEAFKIVTLGLGFTDDTTLSHAGYANVLYELGYIVGDDNGNLNVDSTLTRAEFCTLYNRIIGREEALTVDAEGNEITAETYGFTDLDAEAWYYEIMIRATSAYDDNGFVDIEKRGIRNDLDDYGY